MMSTFNGNSLDGSIKLAYRPAPERPYIDPTARKLANVAMTVAIIAWLIHGAILTFRPMEWTTFLVVLATSISIFGCACAVGAMLERNIPWPAWVAAALLFTYWLVLIATAILRVINDNGGPLPPFP